MWDLIRPAEAALFLDEACVRAWSEPGAQGVGEVQTFVRLVDGQEITSHLVVVEEEEPAFARVRHLDAPWPAQTLFSIKRVDGGVLVRHVQGFDVPEDMTIVDETPLREHAHAFFGALRRALEEQPPNPTSR